MTTKRRWYVDPEQGGFSPAEQEIGLPADDFSARLAEVATMMATTVSEEMATKLLGWMVGVEISKHVLQNEPEYRLNPTCDPDGESVAIEAFVIESHGHPRRPSRSL